MSSFSRKLFWLVRHLFVGFLLVLLLISASLWYVTTDSFQNFVRGRLIVTLERATGGRVELGSFHAIPLRFQVEVRDLTIHGRESRQELPLVHVDSMSAVVNLSSVLGARIGFRSLTLDHPVVHVIFYPDGTTNQPIPKQRSVTDFAQLFAISVDRLEVRRGEVLWQNERLPLEFVANDVSASLDYSFLRRHYSGNLAIGRAETQFAGLRPVAWSGDATFVISRDEVRVRSLRATAEASHIQASGVVSNLPNPMFKGDYDLVLDLAQAAAVARRPGFKSGTLEIRGSGAWSADNFASVGRFDAKDASWRGSAFTAKNFSASGNFSVDPQDFLLSAVQGRFLRGSFTSDAEIHDWRTASKNPKRAKQDFQRASVNIRVKDFSFSELLASLGPQFRPVNKLHFAGSLTGTSEVRWRNSVEKAEITATFQVARPLRIAPGEIPLTAAANLVYRVQPANLAIAQLTANTPASQIRASGDLSSSLNLSFASNDLDEWQPIVDALFPKGMPVTIHGRMAFKGTAAGTIPNSTLAGNLQVNDFTALVPSRNSTVPVHWDSLNGDVQVSPRLLNVRDALLQNHDTRVRLGGTAALSSWSIAPRAPIRVHVDARNLDAALVEPFLKRNIALTGKLNGHAEISGTAARPTGYGTIDWLDGSIEGHAFDTASAYVVVDATQVGFRNLNVAQAQSQLNGSGVYDLAADTFQLKLMGTNFDLSALLPPQWSRIKIGGQLDFSADASGTQAKPLITAHIHLRNVTLNNEEAGNYLLDATTQGPDLHLTGRSDFKGAELAIDGGVRLRDLWPAHINLHFARLDVDSFLESYLHGHLTGHSAVAGDLLVEGPLRDPLRLSLTGNLTNFSASVEQVKLQNQGPLRFTVSRETLKIDSFHVVGDNTDFNASGFMQLSGEHAVNFAGSGKIGLQLVSSYDPDLTGSGTLSGEAQVTGTTAAPVIKGSLRVTNGEIADINLPSALSEMNGSFAFSQNQINIETLTARTGGGTVSFSGHAQLVGRQVNFDLTADGTDVRLRYPPGVSSTANATLHWSGSTAGSLLSGDITVNKLGVTPGFDFGAYLQRTMQTSSLPQTDPVLNKIRLDLHVVTAPELQMQTSVLRLRGEADLRVRGNAAKPVLLGRADIFEGEAYFNGTKYRLERGGVTFGTPAANNAGASVPYVDLEATTRVRDYDITLSINGPADRPKLSYRSEPPLPTNDIIGLLAFGQTTEESAQLQQANQSMFSQQASNAMLAAALNATLNNRTQRLFGNSRIKIDPNGLATETSPTQTGPAVTIEQQVKDNLTLTYTTDVAQSSQQIIRAEYNVSRNVSIVAIRDQNGVVSFDVKIRRRKR